MKEQDKTTEKELNKMKASNLPDAKFTTPLIRMLKKLSENFNKEIASIKRAQKEPVRNEYYNI